MTIAVRMDPANEGIHGHYVLPMIDMTFEVLGDSGRLRPAEDNGARLDV